jgi:hypothetical protein
VLRAAWEQRGCTGSASFSVIYNAVAALVCVHCSVGRCYMSILHCNTLLVCNTLRLCTAPPCIIECSSVPLGILPVPLSVCNNLDLTAPWSSPSAYNNPHPPTPPPSQSTPSACPPPQNLQLPLHPPQPRSQLAIFATTTILPPPRGVCHSPLVVSVRFCPILTRIS